MIKSYLIQISPPHLMEPNEPKNENSYTVLPSIKNLPRFNRFSIGHHCFNGLNLLNWALSIPFANILSEYFWNAKICISALIARFCGGWQFFWRWQIDARWNSCKKTRTIRTLINYTTATLFQIIYGIPK